MHWLTVRSGEKSKYKYIYGVSRYCEGRFISTGWEVRISPSKKYNLERSLYNYFSTEKEAAIWLDKKLIELGYEPINVLKRKENK